ncbi:GNAT family N-acetyltransferase [Salinicoccus hispanicus]|uniref:GNAT family N-acetyltransferase n=1 Tax=Salinicoccus hispanicus TaxID=157225 RepID=A0A6N8TYS7_9STAP|nr:GNAT family N-acetyltransferase [Salinicoccus hispanicus]MXQ51004.1 GNAT family N-acetyltransferase [Salinicoccus hispanicus]
MNRDIYFTKEYAEVNELIEHGEAISIEIQCEYGHITHTAIKREIDTGIDGEKYYDLITPYGYGGPVVHEYVNLKKLIEVFEETLMDYCDKHSIVSEFVRFHPLFQNQESFRSVYDVKYMRKTVGTDLISSTDIFQSEFCATARRRVRKLVKDEKFSCILARGFHDIEDFIAIYNDTMDRHHATDFYYFDRAYFEGLKRKFGNRLVTTSVYFEGQIIAMGLYFISEDIIHDHLNGTLAEHLHHSPAYLLKYTMMNWAKANDFSLVHYGGGVSNAEDDSVLKFKKRFSNHTEFEFHIGMKIWNRTAYDALCRQKGIDKKTDYFPAYRAPRIAVKEN